MSEGQKLTKEDIDKVLMDFHHVIIEDCELWEANRVPYRHERTFVDEEDVWQNGMDLIVEDSTSPEANATRWVRCP